MNDFNYKKPFHLNIPVDIYEFLRKKAIAEDRSVTEIIVEMLRKECSKKKS